MPLKRLTWQMTNILKLKMNEFPISEFYLTQDRKETNFQLCYVILLHFNGSKII